MGRLGFISTAGAVAALLLGAGCTGEPEPRFASPTSSTSPSGSRSESAALTPEETVEAWVLARNEALINGDVSALRSLQTQRCTTCSDLIEPITEIYESGGRFETDGWALNKVERDGVRVEADVQIAGGKTVPSDGASPNVYGPETRRMFAVLQDDGLVWKLKRIGFLV